MDKKNLREKCMAARLAIDPAYAQAAGEALAKPLLELIAPSAKIVAGYRAVRGEIDPLAALQALSAKGHALCLPVVEALEKPLVFHRWQPGDALKKGAYGIDIPSAGETVIPDIVIVPLLAFDKAGHRLGYGAGYYDKTVSFLREANQRVQLIGIAYASQEIERIPAETHDEIMDWIVTEKMAYCPWSKTCRSYS